MVLSDELLGLAFFDDGLSSLEKKSLVKSIRTRQGTADPPKRRDDLTLQDCRNVSLSDLVTTNTMVFFTRLGISKEFFDADPATWEECKDFKQGRDIGQGLRVTNDHTERGLL